MFNILRSYINNKGITLIESLTAVFLTAIAIVALMPMQDSAIRTVSHSDYLGRAEGILQAELELQENIIMNSTDAISPVVAPQTITKNVVYASGLTSGMAGLGDVSFKVITTITGPIAGATKSWTVNVKVTWPQNTTGIKSSIIASRIS
jgi:Tfp pilus assembly protein PilV